MCQCGSSASPLSCHYPHSAPASQKTCPAPNPRVLITFHKPPGNTLNAISTRPAEEPEARVARHLATCRELAELGLDMARSIHAARQAWCATQAAREPAPQPAPTPEPQPAQAAAPTHTPRHATANLGAAFARIVRAVESILALEARIAAEQAAIAQAAAEKIATRAYFAAEKAARNPQPAPAPQSREPAPEPPRPTQTRSANCPEIPSLLATISREIGIDLQDPTLSSRLPRFRQTTDPP